MSTSPGTGDNGNPGSTSSGGGGGPQVAATPEPAGLTLLLVGGLGGLAYARRRPASGAA